MLTIRTLFSINPQKALQNARRAIFYSDKKAQAISFLYGICTRYRKQNKYENLQEN